MRGWRKFMISGAALVMAFVLALLGKLTADFATVASVAAGAFAAGNAVEHWTNGAESPAVGEDS